MKFAIRDDDICFHTDNVLLTETYQEILKLCPVSFSCIPFVGGFDVDRYDERQWSLYDEQWVKWQTKEIFPLADNRALYELLKKWLKDGSISIMLHGIHHDLNEFCRQQSMRSEIEKGIAYLEEIFSVKVGVVSPPNNSLSRAVAQDLDDLGLNLLIAFGHTPDERLLDNHNIKNFLRYLALFAVHKRRLRLTTPVRFRNHWEMPCYTLGPNSDVDELFRGLERTVREDGTFVLATHYYHLFKDQRLTETIRSLIGRARSLTSDKVKFVRAEEIFR